MKYLSFDHFFTILGNKQRVKILQLLRRHGPMSVLSIADKLQVEQSAVSHSLRQLLACHFVSVNKSGKERIYSINEDTVQPMFNLIEQHVKKNCVDGCTHWRVE
ncbi:MAG TPA: metalloregulator ArsR/SmtB family transcription factor [Candidatus Saccharimonadales bacterium]|nr:metalloregulator ArsR/SmtB family transcription factor [Candidatus Saccharimonadales bacterium]